MKHIKRLFEEYEDENWDSDNDNSAPDIKDLRLRFWSLIESIRGNDYVDIDDVANTCVEITLNFTNKFKK